MASHHHKKHFDPAEVYQQKFTKELRAFKEDAEGLARGAISFSGGWKDWLGVAGLSGTFIVGGAILSGIALAGIVSSVASLGIGLAISLVAIGAEVAYTLYRSKKKSGEYHHAVKILSNENFDGDVDKIADHLAKLYFMQISECKRKEDAEKMAMAHLEAIKYELMKNKSFEYQDLLHTGSLQGVLLKGSEHVGKKSVQMDAVKKGHCNVQSLMAKPALYCAENHKFYIAEHSRPEKYGVLVFLTKQELNDYRLMAEKITHKTGPCNDTTWKYSKVRLAEADYLRKTKFFKHHAHHTERVIHEEDSLFSSMDLGK